MPDLKDIAFEWQPQFGDGALSDIEIEELRRSLTRASRGQVGVPLHPPFPLDTWVGGREVLVAARIPGLRPTESKVRLDGQDLHIHAERAGESPVDHSLKLPFAPNRETINGVYLNGILYIHVVRQE